MDEKKQFKAGDLVNVRGHASGVAYGGNQDTVKVLIGKKVKTFKIEDVLHEKDSSYISPEARDKMLENWHDVLDEAILPKKK